MSKRTARLFVYKAKDGWRWRLKSSNGKIVCESGESYKRKPDWYFFVALRRNVEQAEVVTQ